MNILLLFAAALFGQMDVDMTLTPSTQNVTVGCVADFEVVLSAGSPMSVSALDVIVSWDPAELQFVGAIPSADPWFATGFFNDPDNINVDLTDGDALYTALANLVTPLTLPPTTTVVTFQFLVLDEAALEMLPSLGTFGETRVIGTNPGEILTGTISGPVTITTAIGSWTDLGGGAPGANGTPSLSGNGTLAGGCPVGVVLTNAPPNALMLAWISLAPTRFPAVGGIVHAYPFNAQLFFVANPAGVFVGNTTWPKGFPPGTNVWFQFVVQDLSVPDALTISNGLLAITPVP